MGFSKTPIKKFTSKMPHSKLKKIPIQLNSRVGKCPCGQTFNCVSERDRDAKFRLHSNFCSNPVQFSSVNLFHIFLKNIQINQLLQSTKALDTKYNKELLITITTQFDCKRDKIRND